MFCRQCGCELPEGSGVCPNCGRVTSLSTEKPAAKAVGKKKVLIAGAAVLAVVALVVALIIGNQPSVSPNNFHPNTFFSNSSGKSDSVKIKLNLSVEQNSFFAKYGVDVIINGVTVKTLNQGETFAREIEVEKGSFTIKFVKNRSSSDETLNFSSDTVKPAEYTEYVDRDCEISLKIKTHKLSIEIV